MPDPSDRPAVSFPVRCPAPRAVAATLAAAAMAAAAALAHAQAYRQVGPDGRVTFSDLPPTAVAGQARAATSGAADGLDATGLPYAVRTAAGRHPVTLYTAADCAPCNDARAHLARRGVPFAERQVRTGADAAAFKQAGFAEPSFPAVSVGSQRLTGFQAGAWDQLLDLAGYPKSSVLPAGWRPAPAQPLAAGADRLARGDSASEAAAASGSVSAAGPQAAVAPAASGAAWRATSPSTSGPASGPTPASGSALLGGSSGFRF